MTEKLELPALDYEGVIFVGRHHLDAIEQVYRKAVCVEDGIRMVRAARIGFVTDQGRFVGFEEAERIAQQTGQALPWVTGAERPAVSPDPGEVAVGSTEAGPYTAGAFHFRPELFEHRAQAIEALQQYGICWMMDYSAVDIRHDDLGLEVCGIRSKEDASRVRGVLRKVFPAWFCAICYHDHDRTWRVDICCR